MKYLNHSKAKHTIVYNQLPSLGEMTNYTKKWIVVLGMELLSIILIFNFPFAIFIIQVKVK